MTPRGITDPSRDAHEAQLSSKARPYVWFIWFVSLAALVGSLYFSEVRNLPPCLLCWYQRILMYPLVILIPIGLLKKDKFLPLYVLGLALPGAVVALYHTLLQYDVIPHSLGPCLAGVSCTTQQILWLGFITIPLLSFVAFLLIIGTSLKIYSLQKNEK
jgi:disulfide bond formation protein DsbB